jgi:hypothetical protein
MPVAEIVTFKASAAYLANPTIIVPACKKIAEYDGCLGTYTASMEDGTAAYLLVVWKTLDHYKKMMQHSGYAAVLAALAVVHTGPVSVLHYDMTDDPSKAFSAPLTVFSYSTLKDGKSKDAIKPFADAVGKYVDLSHGYSQGWGVEKPNTLLAILGWASLDAHAKATKAPAFQGMVGDAMSIVTLDLKHCKITKRT